MQKKKIPYYALNVDNNDDTPKTNHCQNNTFLKKNLMKRHGSGSTSSLSFCVCVCVSRAYQRSKK